jgi:hypothetical protein
LFAADTADNLRKLDASGADERHLWVWVDDQSPGVVQLPLLSRELPEFPITLPSEVTDLWICNETPLRGWRYSAARGWTGLGPPAGS